MFDVTNFLMRWLFLCNLVRDVAEIQTLPYNPHAHMQHLEQAMSNPATCEEEWRDNCLRGILSYPPGTQRLLVIDSMRAELVKRLSDALCQADQTLQYYESARRKENDENHAAQVTEKDHPFLDADVEILNAFKEELSDDSSETKMIDDTNRIEFEDQEQEETVLVVSKETVNTDQAMDATKCTTHSEAKMAKEDLQLSPAIDEVTDAQQTIRTVRDYLPQLVSVVLKSPPAFECRLLNPIDKLRRLIIKRCVEDANWGVDMCWLLEAEVGRAWKSLFEHRQQTGRRLIVVLPAEKAAVLAKIGTEKREAFDLLQDAEQATAYGYTVPMNPDLYYSNDDQYHSQHTTDDSARLPSSLSLRRCSHFGDTMHFIDRLTKVSHELRQVPTVHRHEYLQSCLKEMNRRLRRRMITRGDVSLDVEDNRGPDDWPLLSDLSTDFLSYSVHLPLDPKQQYRWPGGEKSRNNTLTGGAVRVLNIVVEECKILASRERCPYLVHVEVAETGLSGNDSRLHASGAAGLGATVEEALSMSAAATSAASASRDHAIVHGKTSYQIPPELLVSNPTGNYVRASSEPSEDKENGYGQTSEFLRGGWQSNETAFYPSHPDPDDVLSSIPYNEIRQNQYEQLHHQMNTEHGMNSPLPGPVQESPIVSVREELLDKVFGHSWEKKCEEIRQASPFGKTEGWRLASFIMKAGEDIRREALVMQIIVKLNEWFQTDIPVEIRPHLRPYTIMCVGGDAGLVECLSDAKSIDELKKRTDNFRSLRDYFERAYGPRTTYSAQYDNTGGNSGILRFEEAQENFLRSLVGYSLVCYILQIKDRHNANILLDREGNIIHIDFGFVLGDTPKMSKVPIFTERAPFKLSAEFWDVLGGWNVNQGGLGVRFCHMFENAFASAAMHAEEIASLVEATMLTLTQNSRQARLHANSIRSRLRMRGLPGSREQKSFIMELVNAALVSWGTSTYDWLQKNMNGYQ